MRPALRAAAIERFRTLRTQNGSHFPALLVLLLVSAGAHIGSLDDGLFFDDYWHRAQFRTLGWGWNDLVESATFEVPGRLVQHWWQEQTLLWRYARPIAMFFMKAEYVLASGDARIVHGFALAWHFVACVSVYALAWHVMRQRRWALVAACLFAIHPQSVFAVSWIAARNALISGCFLLAACGTYVYAGRARRHAPRWIALTLGLWGLSLFARESAIVFPALAMLLDYSDGGAARVRSRWRTYALVAAAALLYLYWRLVIFPTVDPPRIYFSLPPAGELPLWAAGKLLHMLFACIWHTPLFLGVSADDGHGALGLHALMLAGVALPIAAYLRVTRGERTRWVWPAWLVCTFLPVIPVFVMPHFAYVPAAGLALMIALGLRRLGRRWRAVGLVVIVLYTTWSFALYRYIWRGLVRCEQLIYADIRTNAAPPEQAATLFFLNLPAAGIYAAVAMREEWQRDDVESYVLTYAPHPVIMEQTSTVEILNDREFIIRTSAPGYFSGLGGQMLREGMRPGSPLVAGTVVPGALFDTTVLEGDEEGITALRFRFHRPLRSPGYYFFVGSPERPAARLRFDTPGAPPAPAHAALFRDARSPNAETARAAAAAIVSLAALATEQVADPLAPRLNEIAREGLDPAARPALLAEIEAWWTRTAASQRLAELEAWTSENRRALRERATYFRIHRLAAELSGSALFLAGGEPRPGDAPP